MVTPVIGWQIDAIRLVVRGDGNAAKVGDVIFAQVLLVDVDDIGWGCNQRLGAVVEGEAVEVTEIACLADAQDHRARIAIELAKHTMGCHVGEIPWPDRLLDRFKDRVLADAGIATQYERMIDLLMRSLHAMCVPSQDVFDVIWKYFLDQ